MRCTLAPPPRLCCCCYSTTIKRWINKRKLDSFFSSQSASFPPSQSPSNFLSHTNSHSFSLCCPFSLSLSLSLSLSHSLGCPIFLRHSLSLFLMLFSYLSLTLSHPAISISQTPSLSFYNAVVLSLSFGRQEGESILNPPKSLICVRSEKAESKKEFKLK